MQASSKKEIIPNRKNKLKSKIAKYQNNIEIKDFNKIPFAKEPNKLDIKKIAKIKNNDSSRNAINNSKEIDNPEKNKNPTDENINIKELNILPFSKALKIDNRNYIQIFLSVLYSEIKVIRLFYYKSPYEHLSILFSKYSFELCLDLTLNCLLYTEDVISEKYNNNGSIKFFTTLSLSFISNIISSMIAFIISKLGDYINLLELIIKDVNYKDKYFLNIIKFKRILCFKLTLFFFLQMIINLMMCYYLMIFCTVYNKTQGSVIINYITGIAESIAISFSLALITSLLRLLSIKYRWKSIYYTSKYFFENF